MCTDAPYCGDIPNQNDHSGLVVCALIQASINPIVSILHPRSLTWCSTLDDYNLLTEVLKIKEKTLDVHHKKRRRNGFQLQTIIELTYMHMQGTSFRKTLGVTGRERSSNFNQESKALQVFWACEQNGQWQIMIPQNSLRRPHCRKQTQRNTRKTMAGRCIKHFCEEAANHMWQQQDIYKNSKEQRPTERRRIYLGRTAIMMIMTSFIQVFQLGKLAFITVYMAAKPGI